MGIHTCRYEISIWPTMTSLILTCFAVICLSAPVRADNRVYVDIYESGQNRQCDTLYLGGHFQVRVWIENDVRIGAFSIPVHLWSPDSLVAWSWTPQTDYTIGQGRYATYVPGSRIDPPYQVFDLAGVATHEMDLPDWFCIYTPMELSGEKDASLTSVKGSGLLEGPLEHMLSMHIQLSDSTPSSGYAGTLCIEQDFPLPIYPEVWLMDWSGQDVPVTVNLPQCWPVVVICGNPNGDNAVNIGDAVFIVNYIFKQGPSPDPWQLGDANGDGKVNIGDAVYLVAYIFKGGPAPVCP